MSWAAAGQQTFNRAYTYDQLNRLSTMSAPGSTCSGLSWTYDAWGNRTDQTVTGGTCGTSHVTVGTNNRLTTTGFTYDAAGNMTHDASHSYTYDAENRLTQVDGGTTASYVYDVEGRRVEKSVGTTKTEYLYDLNGNVISELNQSTWLNVYLRLNGSLFAQYTVGGPRTQFVHVDHLGSTRLLTTMTKSVADSLDYLPFGEQIAGDTGTTHKFTGKERDAESGLDNFEARYYGSILGRFMQTDPIWVKADRMLDPQRLNLYSYVRNNPLTLTDPSGMDVVLRTCSGSATMTQCFKQVQDGLKKEDRSHVHLVEGDGKNGFKKGQYGITVDADYKGSAGNFSTLQKLANDHSATANVDVLNPNDSFNVRVSLSYDAKKGYGNLSTMSMTPDDQGASFEGYTFFPPGKNSPSPFSADDDTDVVVNNSTDVPATIHHELRHVLLGDFGRMGNNAKHGLPEVDKQTNDAEKEAQQNEKEQ
jgi:RHS repeat-associated protein